MERPSFSPLQVREVFHLEFLRGLSRQLGADQYVLKGGVNLRFFFGSIRYSEDMDIDVCRAGVEKISKVSMGILSSRGFSGLLRTFGIKEVVPPDMSRAKQTGTTQRFKVHLVTVDGQDFFTKVEFSRRSVLERGIVEPVSPGVLRAYRMPPLLVPHYDAPAAVRQKIAALARRTVLQARDIFDLFLLGSQLERSRHAQVHADPSDLPRAIDNVFQADFALFRDSVVAYLAPDDQKAYASPAAWDEVKLNASRFLEEVRDAA